MNSSIALIGSLVVFVVILLIPWIFKDRKRAVFEGPDLTELQYTEVFFNHGDLRLAGLLFIPEGAGPFPAVVIIHGSGTSKRNNSWYLAVVQHLQENGIAVLLPDKRGSEKSAGDWKKATFLDFAGDTGSAVDFIKNQTIFACSTLGVLGHSQGGWVASIVAAENKDVAFAACWSGAGVTVDEQILYQSITDITGWTYQFIAKMLAPLAAKFVMKQDHCRMLVGFDPLPYWRQATIPAFMAFGEIDKAVPVKVSVQKIQSLNKSNIAVKVYPQSGHGLASPVAPGIYRMREDFLGDLVGFIRRSYA